MYYKLSQQNTILENFQSVNQLIINSHTDTFYVIQCYSRPFYIQNNCRQLFLTTNDIANTPFTKKGNKQILINYRPVSLLPTCGKHLEETILFLKTFFNTSWKTICLIQISQASCLVILVYINLFQLPNKYMTLLLPILHQRLKVFFRYI